MDRENNVVYPGFIDWRCPRETMVWAFVNVALLTPFVLQSLLFLIHVLKTCVSNGDCTTSCTCARKTSASSATMYDTIDF